MTISNWGASTLVNSTLTGDQFPGVSATLNNGNYVVAWTDKATSTSQVSAQIFDPAGNKIGSQFLAAVSGDQGGQVSSIVGLSDGGFAVSYISARTVYDNQQASIYTLYDYKVAHLSALGTLQSTATVDTFSSAQRASYITSTNSGYAVSYYNPNQNSGDVIFKSFDIRDNQIGSSTTVNTTTASSQFSNGITTLSNGNVVVSWIDFSNYTVKARVLSSTGASVTGEITAGFSAFGSPTMGSVVGLDNGGFAVVWANDGYQGSLYPDTQGSSIQARIYGADGTPATNYFTVNTTATGSQITPDISALSGGKFMVSWTGTDAMGAGQIYSQVVGYNGAGGPSFIGGETQTTNNMQTISGVFTPSLNTLLDGRVVQTWTDGTALQSGLNIYQQILDPRDGFDQGTAGNDVIYGSQTFANEMHGLAGNDVMIGGLASDQIFGGAGSDLLDGGLGGINRLYGGTGDDNYVVHSQNDYIYENVNEGFDTVYADGTDYSLTLNAGGANIEALVIRSDNHVGAGSGNADLLIAQANNVQLFGGGGNDTLVAHGTGDILYGSVGDDSYVTTTRSVSIREAPNEGNDTIYADNTDFSLADAPNVENLVIRGNNHVGAGTDGIDLLVSQGISNFLFGGGGNDTFSFTLAHGASQVLDFDARPGEHDVVAFSTAQFANFAAIQSHLTQIGSDAVITASDNSGDTFILKNVVASHLQASDFLFV